MTKLPRGSQVGKPWFRVTNWQKQSLNSKLSSIIYLTAKVFLPAKYECNTNNYEQKYIGMLDNFSILYQSCNNVYLII